MNNNKLVNKIYNAYLSFWFSAVLLIIVGNWIDIIRFGYGLGDLIYLIFCIIALLIFGLISFMNFFRKVKINKLFLVLLSLIFLLFLLLKLTYFRGSASPWDGHFFILQ